MFKSILMAGVAACASVPGAAFAQDAATVDDIVVTAQRRSEALQDVPLAVTAIDGAAIAERGLIDVRDLLATTPGATFSAINAAEPQLSIRGITSGGEGAASDSGVLMMVDGEVISRDFMRSAPLFDIARVEVLRGPQGTTYGRNATGGVFHVINRKPGRGRSADVDVTIGDYGAWLVNLAGETPVGEATAARLAVQYQSRDGYSEDVYTGRDVDNRESLAARLTVVHDFTEEASLTVRLHGSRERHGDTGPLKSFDPTQPLLGPPFITPPFTEPSTDPYKIVTSGGGFFDRDVWGASVELKAPVAGFDLTALTTFRHGDGQYLSPAPLAYNTVNARNDADVFSQEIRLERDLIPDRLYGVAGLFYIHEDVSFGYDRVARPGTPLATTQILRQASQMESLGVFGELVWNVTDRVRLTAGGRFSRDDKAFQVSNSASGAFATFFVQDPSRPVVADVKDRWEAPTGRISLEYRASEDLMGYVTVSQGYKSGGFNLEPSTQEAATTPFDEEKVTNIEAGLRSQLFQDRLRVNLTVFDMAYSDIQTSFFSDGGSELTGNIAEATIRGFEAEITARPNPHLTLSAAYAGYDATYDEFFDDGDDLSGSPLAKTPDWTLTLSAVLTTPEIGGWGRARLRADYATRSSIVNDAPADYLQGVRPGSDMLDLRAAWLPNVGAWEAAVFVRNALDEAEVQYIGPATILSQRPVIYGAPRTVGVTLTYRFGD